MIQIRTLFNYGICLLLLFSSAAASAQYQVMLLDSNAFDLGAGVILRKTSFRGVSAPDAHNIWISGSRGTIAKSTDGGKTFHFMQVKNYEQADFRDIEAFDGNNAIMMSSGTPAYILKTTDGGATWKEVYKNMDAAYFLDAMGFWNKKNGVIAGDPVNGYFVILHTQDGGESWQQLDTLSVPKAMTGEALFAASGTSLRCFKNGTVEFITGGSISRSFSTNMLFKQWTWNTFKIDIIQGEQSQGAFSFAMNPQAKIFVGGDYTKNTVVLKNAAVKYITCKTDTALFSVMADDVKGYRSCVEAISNRSFIACGTSGVDLYKDKYWKTISTESFNVAGRSKKGGIVFLAGNKGKIARLIK